MRVVRQLAVCRCCCRHCISYLHESGSQYGLAYTYNMDWRAKSSAASALLLLLCMTVCCRV
jgi:hypothetical protein